MFDLTKEIELSPHSQKLYASLRILIYLLFAAGIAYLALAVFFPKKYFNFSFRTAEALKNTVLSPRDQEKNLLEKGLLKKDSRLIFDTPLDGDFSQINVSFYLEKDSPPVQNGYLSVKKSFQSFFFPEGPPMNFKEGELLRQAGDYFIISGGKLRKFAFLELVRAMGYNLNSFAEINPEEIGLNETGEDIELSSKYPSGTLFKITDDFYQLVGNVLYKFVSARAFLTKYDAGQAVEKNEDFLKDFAVAESLIGFSDGTLVAYGKSAFIARQGELLPIDTEITFKAMGFNWNDLIPADSEEFSAYTKGKLFTIFSPHPDGTIFSDTPSGKYYYIQDGKKREMRGSNIQKSHLRHAPVLADEKGLEIKTNCQLEKKIGFSRKYNCQMPLGDLQVLAGNDYQFELANDNEIRIKEISVIFEQNINSDNLRLAIADIKSKIKLNYGIQD